MAAQGSIIVSDGNGRVSALAPTSNDEVLVIDSTSPNGVKFANVKNYLPPQKLKSTSSAINSTNLSTYTKILDISVPGENTNPIQSIDVVCWKDGSVTSCDVKIVNGTDGQLIAEDSFTNNNVQINNMGALSNLPATSSIIEVSIKRTGGSGSNKTVYLTGVDIDVAQ